MKKSQIKKGAFIVVETKAPWSGPGFPGLQWHKRKTLAVVTGATPYRAEYKDVKMLEETGCPPAPTGRSGELTVGGFSLDGTMFAKMCALPTASDFAGVDVQKIVQNIK
jgi:hypothetical protein